MRLDTSLTPGHMAVSMATVRQVRSLKPAALVAKKPKRPAAWCASRLILAIKSWMDSKGWRRPGHENRLTDTLRILDGFDHTFNQFPPKQITPVISIIYNPYKNQPPTSNHPCSIFAFHYPSLPFTTQNLSASKEMQGTTGHLQGKSCSLDRLSAFRHRGTHQEHGGNHPHHRCEGRHSLP